MKLYKKGEVTIKMYNDRFHWFLKENDTLVNGAIVDYHENSRLKLKFQVKNGMNHGTHKRWLINGNLRTHENFKNNLPHLEQKYFDENGKIIRIKEYFEVHNIRFRTLNQNTNNWEERVFNPAYQFSLKL